MKNFSSVYIIIFSLLLSSSAQVVTARYDTGEKKIVCDLDGAGINEKITKRYHFSKEGNLLLTEDFVFMEDKTVENKIKIFNDNLWKMQIFDYKNIYLGINSFDLATDIVTSFKKERQIFPQKFYINDNVFYSMDLNNKCVSDTILDFSNAQIQLRDTVNSINFSYKFLSPENLLLNHNEIHTYYSLSTDKNIEDIQECLYHKRIENFQDMLSGKWYTYDGLSVLDFSDYNVEYLDSGYVVILDDSVKVSYFNDENPSIYFMKDNNEYIFYRNTFNEMDEADSTLTGIKIEFEKKTVERQESSSKSSWIQGTISVLIIIFVIAQTIGG